MAMPTLLTSQAQRGADAKGASAPPAGSTMSAANLRRLQDVLDRFEISIAEAHELAVLKDYEMVVIADDSGSMRSSAVPLHLRRLTEPNATRWDELRATLGEMIEVMTCFDDSGVDIFFLNRPPVLGVRSATDEEFVRSFAAPPGGSTPLTETLQRVAAKTAGERPVLLFIFTDGEPNGGKEPFKRTVRQLVSRTAAHKVRIQIMACTANDDEVAWLNDLDREFYEVDVTDDYFSERAEVLKAGLAERFTRGDWCMKAMLGPVSRKFDAWDEPSLFNSCKGCSIQ